MKFHRALSACILLIAAGSLWAHHSPSAVFDMTKRFTLTGTLTKVDWINPHIVFLLEAKVDGKTENWTMESNPPAWFKRVGISRADFAKAVNQTVTVEGVRAKDGTFYAYLQKIKMPDGTSVELTNSDK